MFPRLRRVSRGYCNRQRSVDVREWIFGSHPYLELFWKYVFHYIDYQAYAFQGMMVNELKYRTYD